MLHRPTSSAARAAGTTDASGNYSFPVMPTSNTVYVVKTVLPPNRHSARLFEGVQDLITFTPSTTSTQVGQVVTFTGTVTPDKAGDVIYLERQGKDGALPRRRGAQGQVRLDVPVRVEVR